VVTKRSVVIGLDFRSAHPGLGRPLSLVLGSKLFAALGTSGIMGQVYALVPNPITPTLAVIRHLRDSVEPVISLSRSETWRPLLCTALIR
jgi:hypothetical protein